MKNLTRPQKDIFAHKTAFLELFQKRPIILFLDFDGTLAEIADHYKKATILKESKTVLKALSQNPRSFVAVISGRALPDVTKRVGLKNVIYAGNHGLEIEGRGIPYTTFIKPRIKHLLQKILRQLAEGIGSIPGVLIEDKGLTLSVHYRRVHKNEMLTFPKIFMQILKAPLAAKKIMIHNGKKVFDIIPMIDWDKGKAALWLLNRLNQDLTGPKLYPVFIGDDVTDETAFKALKNKGLCIRVGKSATSAAPYYLRDILANCSPFPSKTRKKYKYRGLGL